MARITAEDLKGFNAEDVLNMAFDFPDWPTVLMIGTFLELLLERAISTRFEPEQPLSKERQQELFAGYGPLASFSAKISVGYALGLIPKSARDDLNIIKSIRNDAAHRIRNFSFESDESRQKCSSLTLITRPEGFEQSTFHEKWVILDTNS